jgi:hypothetical protein
MTIEVAGLVRAEAQLALRAAVAVGQRIGDEEVRGGVADVLVGDSVLGCRWMELHASPNRNTKPTWCQRAAVDPAIRVGHAVAGASRGLRSSAPSGRLGSVSSAGRKPGKHLAVGVESGRLPCRPAQLLN